MIDKRAKTILYVLLGVVVMLFFFESSRPRPLNWQKSFTSGDKIPFGAFVLYDQLDEIFNRDDITSVDEVPVDFLLKNDSITNANYIFINDYLSFDSVESDYLMDFVARGNKVFIASNGAYGTLADTLGLETNSSSFYSYSRRDTVRTRLVNKSLKDRSYVYDKGADYKFFEVYDTLNTKVLGEVLAFEPSKGYIADYLEETIDNDEGEKEEKLDINVDDKEEKRLTRETPQVNFVEIKVGDGAFYYNLNPISFTNYYMLKDGKHQYAVEALSYMNDGPVFFDDYGKSGRKVITSPMRFVLSQPALKWAYYIALLGVIIYMIFASKRRQRIIPIVEPLKNSSVEFTKTIGSLYYQTGDYSGIIDKKINYFLERLRSKYFVDTQRLDTTFIKRLAVKSGRSQNFTEDVILYINKLRAKSVHNEYELKQLNKRIEAFLKE
ncbi:DUF4350 domain-containing protein [Nonlabens ulvanivorans]|uniref:Uncharacterized protein DUF4350 n=1 Tax=Nonlabens ulvanivorans TaxID=906888 RepID=A0A081DAB2_NONUL|nr:DUF4350 domain-containing protein [Nonlabens ulvanivorans]KEZ93056.1 hypothetical protein IL45_13080 [Nonlabens ulvanivorans]PRX12714.1 uncharacterized protein DUF4350 [Nonlabens ulvanivorans]GAK75858.1 hypothetical protein JCM19296_1450 [Nonlabens ulvanivorans]GAL75581.1 hypothetical protein JCM19275_2032 [Nonlabens ulvanivorans]